MRAAYASDTSVSVARSRGEIDDLVSRAGGTKFATMSEEGRAVVLFELRDRRIMFELALPPLEQFAKHKNGWGKIVAVPPEKQHKAWEQACRSRWRALLLAIKAKLVSVDAQIETLEEAFLAHIVVSGNEGSKRFAHYAIKSIARAYDTGTLPPMLPAGEKRP